MKTFSKLSVVRHRAAILSALLALGLVCALPSAFAKAPPPVQSLAPMLEQVLPAVVNISTETRVRKQYHPLLDDPFFRRFFKLPEQRARERESHSLGSGVIIDAAKGYILTNHHVVDGADEIKVRLRDRRQVPAKLVGQDPEVDVALLQIEADHLTALPVADSDALRVGDFVVAIGNPFGLSQTVTYGIVSALGRSGLGIEGYENFIQTDASINPGNSGGALVDMQGRLVGINTAIVGPNGGNVGIGFAIPSNMALAIRDHLIVDGEVRRGQLGVAMQDLTPELALAFGLQDTGGAVIAEVVPGSAAEEAGLRPGDVVVGVNGKPVASASALRNRIGLVRTGTLVKIDFVRDGRSRSTEARLKDAGAGLVEAGRMSGYLAGARIGPLESGHPLFGAVEGVEIRDVEPGSTAWSAGLRKGDVIVSANRRSVTSVAELEAALEAGGDALLLHVRRDGEAFFLVLR